MGTMPNASAAFSGDPTGAGAIFAGPTNDGDPVFVVARLNALLRGEISAAETYRNVLERFAAHDGHADVTAALQPIHEDHLRTSAVLRSRITEFGGEPAESSGLWGVWAQTVQGALSLFGGDVGGLRALHEGEEHGLKDYEAALNDVDATSAQLIQNRCIPSQQKHIETLLGLLATK